MVAGSRPVSDSARATMARRAEAVSPLSWMTQAFLDDFRHRHARRQRAIRVLEHDLDFLAQRPHLAGVQPVDVLAEIDNGAVRADQAEQRQTDGGLARAEFADQRQVWPFLSASDTPSTAFT